MSVGIIATGITVVYEKMPSCSHAVNVCIAGSVVWVLVHIEMKGSSQDPGPGQSMGTAGSAGQNSSNRSKQRTGEELKPEVHLWLPRSTYVSHAV